MKKQLKITIFKLMLLTIIYCNILGCVSETGNNNINPSENYEQGSPTKTQVDKPSTIEEIDIKKENAQWQAILVNATDTNPVKWTLQQSSEKDPIIEIDSNTGAITPKKPGKATIQAQIGNKNITANLEVGTKLITSSAEKMVSNNKGQYVSISYNQVNSFNYNSVIRYKNDGDDDWKEIKFDGKKLDSIAYGDGIYLVIGKDKNENNLISYSQDGSYWYEIEWEEFDWVNGANNRVSKVNFPDIQLIDITYGKSSFIIIGKGKSHLNKQYCILKLNYNEVNENFQRQEVTLNDNIIIDSSDIISNNKLTDKDMRNIVYGKSTDGSNIFVIILRTNYEDELLVLDEGYFDNIATENININQYQLIPLDADSSYNSIAYDFCNNRFIIVTKKFTNIIFNLKQEWVLSGSGKDEVCREKYTKVIDADNAKISTEIEKIANSEENNLSNEVLGINCYSGICTIVTEQGGNTYIYQLIGNSANLIQNAEIKDNIKAAISEWVIELK